ncbi:SBP domain-containing protein [Dioscorea alata]|uniref:SBP domain-containing protein n=1 Tax=Dioscorea alata TaxID=55571 RepID=A0ACB7UGJ1_DIOAL|nr:SBP domain-containing protein [Dioscorea alata]
MFLEYEWTNPAAAAAAAMLLFSEENQQVINDHRQVYNHHFGHDLTGDFFCQPTTIQAPPPAPALPTSGLFPMPTSSSSSLHGLALPPAPTRLGLNLGVRTYFSSEEGMMVTGRVSRRRPRMVRCQAEGCGTDLTHAKHYHRRHKVCEFHSKASIVITAGLSQRFCQQCSRFHVLSEFDQGKRSCRKRLAEHNRRRRKSHDLITSTAGEKTPVMVTEKVLFTTSDNKTDDHVLSLPPPPPPPPPQEETNGAPMVLGLGFNSNESGDLMVVPAPAGLSGSSSTGTSPCRFPVQLGDFGEHENHNHFPNWDDGEDGSSIRALFS